MKVMKTISLKLDENIFAETEKILQNINMSRNRYINEALDHYNNAQRRILLEKMLRKESNLVQEESIVVLKDFESIESND